MNSKLLTDEVYNILLSKITEKEWKVGDKLPSENKLCEQFHVSRISIRTAIQKLQAQNLVVTKPGKGSFVSSNHIGENMISFSIEKMNITSNEYRYVMELRRAIEFTSVELMCQHGQSQDFEALKTALDHMVASGSDARKYVEADFEFHMAMIKGSHNPLFATVMRGCKTELLKYFREMADASGGNFQRAIQNHSNIYQAILERDAEKTKRIIEGTFEYNLERFKNLFKEE